MTRCRAAVPLALAASDTAAGSARIGAVAGGAARYRRPGRRPLVDADPMAAVVERTAAEQEP